jgi:hypothetical protein
MHLKQTQQPDAIAITISRLLSSALLGSLIGAMLLCSQARAGGLVRLTDKQLNTLDGKILGVTPAVCSIMDRQGRLHHKEMRDLKSLEKVSVRFKADSTGAFREALRAEFKGYEVAGTTHYLVCAPPGRADQYAELFETIYRDVVLFYRVRGFTVKNPDVPMVAVIFRSQSEFAQYCRRDNVPPSQTLMGYYSLLSNRVALFDDPSLLKTAHAEKQLNVIDGIAAYAAISGNTADTVIHETTHQVSYNVGVHSRLGGTPVWVVEGLATVLEPSGMRKKEGRHLMADRINTERADWFENKHRPTRAMGDLAKLIASDEYFFKSTLDSYSEAWAFTFFLMEKPSRRQEFVRYLQTLGKRDPIKAYTAEARLSDFQAAFGDISRLEVDFIRFLDRM